MNKKELALATIDEPGSTEIQIAIKTKGAYNFLCRKVMGVKRVHDKETGRDVIRLYCYRSIKEEAEAQREAELKREQQAIKAERTRKRRQAGEQDTRNLEELSDYDSDDNL